ATFLNWASGQSEMSPSIVSLRSPSGRTWIVPLGPARDGTVKQATAVARIAAKAALPSGPRVDEKLSLSTIVCVVCECMGLPNRMALAEASPKSRLCGDVRLRVQPVDGPPQSRRLHYRRHRRDAGYARLLRRT